MLRTSLHWDNICAITRAPQSSKRGIVCLLMGATRVLDITIHECTTPLESLKDVMKELHAVRALSKILFKILEKRSLGYNLSRLLQENEKNLDVMHA